MELKKVYLLKAIGEKKVNGIDKETQYEEQEVLANVGYLPLERQFQMFGKIYQEVREIHLVGLYKAEKLCLEKDGERYSITQKIYHDNNTIFSVITNDEVIGNGK